MPNFSLAGLYPALIVGLWFSFGEAGELTDDLGDSELFYILLFNINYTYSLDSRYAQGKSSAVGKPS